MQEVTKVGGEKTLETWLDRGSIEVVRVFVGRSHPSLLVTLLQYQIRQTIVSQIYDLSKYTPM
jgi:hypothetical protein